MPEESSQHWVYVAVDSSLMTKVGFTSDLDQRLASHRTSNPTIEIAAALPVASRECAAEVERLTHLVLRYRREQPEWFSYSVANCVLALEAAASAWNELMRVRYTLVGWHPDYKKEASPFVTESVRWFDTEITPPSQGRIDVHKIESVVSTIADIAGKNPKGSEGFKRIASSLTENDLKDLDLARQWFQDYVRASKKTQGE